MARSGQERENQRHPLDLAIRANQIEMVDILTRAAKESRDI